MLMPGTLQLPKRMGPASSPVRGSHGSRRLDKHSLRPAVCTPCAPWLLSALSCLQPHLFLLTSHLLVLAGSWGKQLQAECASVSRHGPGGIPGHSCPLARAVQFPIGQAPAVCPISPDTSHVLTGYPTPGAGDTEQGGDALSLP